MNSVPRRDESQLFVTTLLACCLPRTGRAKCSSTQTDAARHHAMPYHDQTPRLGVVFRNGRSLSDA
jgi:hypothetical protein